MGSGREEESSQSPEPGPGPAALCRDRATTPHGEQHGQAGSSSGRRFSVLTGSLLGMYITCSRGPNALRVTPVCSWVQGLSEGLFLMWRASWFWRVTV